MASPKQIQSIHSTKSHKQLSASVSMHRLALLLFTFAVAHASVTVTRTSNDGPHPSSMEIEVTLPDTNKQILIPLNRTDAFENIPMTVVENGVSRTFSSHQVHDSSHGHYRNVTSKAVISVRHVNGKKRLSGHVMHEGTSYFLEPVGESEHRVTKNHRNPEVMERQTDLGKNMQARRKRQTNSSPTTNNVELYLLIDSTVWNGFITVFGNEAAALSEFHFYYTHILNGIDTAYRNIGTPSISVSCIGITISKTSADDAWMPTGTVEGSDILTKMTDYIVSQPSADHFMAFTRIDITGDGSSSVCGMAYVSGTCTGNKVSINEDKGLQSWGTAAHELGHNLGSNHDGDGNTCSSSTQNIMSPTLGSYTLSSVGNSYRFSTCSVDYITKYIASLGPTSCLLSSQGTRLTQLTSNLREGARLTLDQVCRLSYLTSPGKFFLDSNSKSNPASICAGIFCTMSGGGGSASGGLRAPVGTPCGNQKSCDWTGQCTTDLTAPVADEKCFWGDSKTSSYCLNWKEAIVNGWDVCKSSVKQQCCKTLAGVPQCNGV